VTKETVGQTPHLVQETTRGKQRNVASKAGQRGQTFRRLTNDVTWVRRQAENPPMPPELACSLVPAGRAGENIMLATNAVFGT